MPTSLYPSQLDNSTSLPPAPSGPDGYSVPINADISAIEAIETELGVTPSGPYATVRTRLDILESRINNPCVPVNSDFISIGNIGITVIAGQGDPNALAV